jgi:dihydroxyacetone kinase
MKGFSLTFLEIDGTKFAEALLAPINVHGWVPAIEIHGPIELPARNPPTLTAFTPSQNEVAEKVIRAACEALKAAEGRLNQLDAAVGDGDTGRTFALGANAVLEETAKLPLNDTPQLFLALSGIAGRVMGGSSGVLLAIEFIETARVLKSGEPLVVALQAGVAKMSKLGGAEVGFRTMLDALVPAIAALEKGVKEAADAAEVGAESTRSIEVARAGRSSYLTTETLVGNPDPGAVAVAIVFRAIADQF